MIDERDKKKEAHISETKVFNHRFPVPDCLWIDGIAQNPVPGKGAICYDPIDSASIYDYDPSTKLGDDVFGTIIADLKNDAPGRCSHGGPVCLEYPNGHILAIYANTSDHNSDG